MFENNSLWIHAKRGYLPEQATSSPPRGDVFVDGAPLPSESSQAGTGPGTKIGAGGKPQGYDSYGRYTGPRGGAVSLRDGSIHTFEGDRLYANADKQAGADSEAGRREPRSLLSATAEELDKIAAGTSQAVTQGAAGAKQALGRTWEELSTNQELHKGVEFGVKAAGEVSKDVWAKAGEDAATAYAVRAKAALLGESAGELARSTAKGVLINGGNDLFEWPEKARGIGARIENLKKRIYEK